MRKGQIPDLAPLRRDTGAAHTGARLKAHPSGVHQTTIDLDLWLDGPVPVGFWQQSVKAVAISARALLARLRLWQPVVF
jgi:hypothetical protein